MNSWQRITLVTFFLIGGTASFGYWSINQFNYAFDNLSASYIATTNSINSSFKQNTDLASTSPEVSGAFSSSTDKVMPAPVVTATKTATTTNIISEPSFTFPQKSGGMYGGCTYPISWQSQAKIKSFEIVLVDAGTRELVGPIASGLIRENVIVNNSQNLNWKIGSVWPGKYYIKVAKINNDYVEVRSEHFTIKDIPKGTDTAGREKLCKESGGSF